MVRLKIGQVKKVFFNGSDENVSGENGWGKKFQVINGPGENKPTENGSGENGLSESGSVEIFG